jgi:starvation-inducible DNA-binding protein
MNPTRNHLKPAVRKASVELLNATVADLLDLYMRTKQAHWNLRGDTFFSLHMLLDGFAATQLVHIDTVAERATALGGGVEGTLRQAVHGSKLGRRGEPKSKSGQRDWIRELADSSATCGAHVHAAIKRTGGDGDFVTADRLTGLLHDLDKQLWILESHLNR